MQFMFPLLSLALCAISIASSASANDRVLSLPGIGDLSHTKVYSGYVNVNKVFNSNLYYLFFESQGNPSTDPVVVWFQGGPGCSSLFGAFIENGPYLIQLDGSFKVNDFSWNKNASLLYIDQPVDTGFSYVENPLGLDTNEKEIAKQSYELLAGFFNLHPEYSHLDLFLFGESYGGHYVPNVADYTLKQNNTLNLRGIGLGNPYTDPVSTQKSYGPFLFERNRIGKAELDVAQAGYEGFKLLVEAHLYSEATIYGNLLLEEIVADAHIGDVYDITQPSDPTTPLNTVLTKYLRASETKQALFVKREWTGCNALPDIALIADSSRSCIDLLPFILSKIRVLVYSGANDLICNLLGALYWTDKIDWPMKVQFNNAVNQTLSVDGKEAGYFKTAGSLTYLVVNNASHMSPFSQPKNTHYMLQHFLADIPF